MCRLALQLLVMLGNVLGRPQHALQRLKHALQRPWPTSACFCKVLGVPHQRETPPTCCLISYETKGVVYHQVSYLEAWWYTTASGGVSLRCGTPRTLQKHAEVSQGRCQTCLRRCKACQGRLRTLPSMPRTLQSVHTHLRYPQF